MKTSAISTPANLTSGTATTGKKSGAVSDTPFSQMLSREMAAQPKPSEPAKADKTQNSKEPQAAKREPESSESSETSAAKSAQPSNASQAQESVPAKVKKSDASETKQAKDDKDQDDDPIVSAESEELLALVASLTQPTTQGADSKADDKTDDKADLKADVKADAKLVDESEQTIIDTSDKGAQSESAAKDFSLIAQATSNQNATPGLNAGPAEKSPIPVQRGNETGVPQTAGAARRNLGIGTGGRPQTTGTGAEVRSEPGEFDTKLTQAKDEKSATGTTTVKADSAPSEFVLTQSADKPAPKPVQEMPQPAIAPLNMNAISQAQMQPTPAMAAQAAEMLAPRVGSQGWDQALGQKVVWMVGSDVQSASLTLNPPDLGPLQVVLHVSENQATANFIAAQPEVRHALENAMPKLREMLGDAGIQLSQANVNAGNPNNNPQNAFEQPQQSSRQASAATNDDNDTPAVRVGRSQAISSREGLVDTFA